MKKESIFPSILSILLALAIFVLAWMLATGVSNLMNMIFKREDLIGKLIYELFPAALGTYFGLKSVVKLIKNYNALFVLIGYVIIQQIFFIGSFVLFILVKSPLYSLIVSFLMIPVCFFTSLYVYKHDL